jgi:undecaprenyl-diphosphatase
MRRADRDAFHALARYHSPPLDATLPRLSRAANHGALWVAIGAGLAAFGGRSGRRAATRGLLSLAAASALANLPAKLAIRRTRPDPSIVPQLRRLLKQPTSFSFPSGHSASAGAFAVGAGLELPGAAPALGVLAAGVGVSRVYTGAHYPSDVIVGMTIGAGVALLSQRSWPVTRVDDASAVERGETKEAGVDEHGEGLTIVVNPAAGGALSDPKEALSDALPKATVIEASGDDIEQVLPGRTGRSGAVGVAGGDGTVNVVAAAAHGMEAPLLVIPGGTLNHFARDLGLRTVEDAIAAWKNRRTLAVDVATIDGKVFLNTASFGPYAEFVDERDKLATRLGKGFATPVALMRVLRRARPQEVEIDGKRRRIWMVFIGNCRYAPAGFVPAARRRLDDGRFDVRMITAERRLSRFRAVAAALTGTLQRSPVYEEKVVEDLELRSLDGPLHLARDGETWDGPDRVLVEKKPNPLAVFVVPDDGSSRVDR